MGHIRSILIEPNPVLRKKAKMLSLKEIQTPEIRELLKKMSHILLETKNGVGLAAPQIGMSKAIFVALKEDVSVKERETFNNFDKGNSVFEHIIIFINPSIIKHSRTKKAMHEGCLSVPDMYGETKRYEKITVEAYNENGKKFRRGSSGLLSQIIQHEIDHLNGILFIDHAALLVKEIKEQ